jgi:hypothetical protein
LIPVPLSGTRRGEGTFVPPSAAIGDVMKISNDRMIIVIIE